MAITVASLPLPANPLASPIRWVATYFKPSDATAKYVFKTETTPDVFYSPTDGFLVNYIRINPYYGPYSDSTTTIP